HAPQAGEDDRTPPDRARIHAAADSRDVLEPDLSRDRLLRRRGSLAWLLRAYGARAVRFPGGAPRRASQGAFHLRSPPLPRAGIETAQPLPHADAQAEGNLAQGGCDREQEQAPAERAGAGGPCTLVRGRRP